MTYFEDLSRCDYFGPFAGDAQLVAVGWLDHLHPFATGDILPGVMGRLVQFLKDPWDLGAFWGWHLCEICREGVRLVHQPKESYPDREALSQELSREMKQFPGIPGIGQANLFIPVPGSLDVYVAPSLVVHYMKSRQYCPPLQFQEALMYCPEMNSPSYLGHMRSRGLTKDRR